jgi:hypothetical protein
VGDSVAHGAGAEYADCFDRFDRHFGPDEDDER